MRGNFLLPFLWMLLLGNAIHAQEWKTLADSARTFQAQRKSDIALQYFTRSKNLLVVDSPRSAALGILNRDMANVYQGQGKYVPAEKLFVESKDIFSYLKGREAVEYFRSCNHLNYMYVLMGRSDTAMKLCMETYDAARKEIGSRHYEFSRACRNLGMLNRAMGRFTTAGDFLLEAQAIVLETRGRNTFEYASITNDVGALYLLMGRSEEALEQLLAAKDGYATTVGKESPSYGSVTNNLGLVYKNMQEYALSEQYYKEALRVRQIVEGDKTPNYAQASYNLADLYLLIGQFSKAEQLLSAAEAVYKATVGPEHPEYARVCSKLGILYTYLDDYVRAESYLRLSRAIREKRLSRNHPEFAISSWYMAEMFHAMNKPDSAEKYLYDAHVVWRAALGEKHPEVFNSSLGLARLYLQQRQFEKTKAMLDEIVPAWSHFGPANSSHRQVQGMYGRLYWVMGDEKNASTYYTNALASQLVQVRDVFRFTSEREKMAFLSNVVRTNDEFYSYFNKTPGKAASSYDLTLAYRELVLSSFRSLQENIHSGGDTTLINIYRKWMGMRETLADYYASNQASDDIKALEDSANNLEKELVRRSPDAGRHLNAVTWNTISEKLKPDEAAIEFIHYGEFDGEQWTDSVYYAAIILQKGKAPEVVRLFEERQLMKLVDLNKAPDGEIRLNHLYAWRPPVQGRNPGLYDLIWKPIDEKLKKARTVYFTPGGSLFRVSFAAIPVNATETVADRYQLVQLNTTASVTEEDALAPMGKADMVLFGGIRYDSDSASMLYAAAQTRGQGNVTRSSAGDISGEGDPDFRFLDQTAREINAIKAQAGSTFPYRTYTEILATEEAFKSLSGEQSPGILHVATHGFFSPDIVQAKRRTLQSSATLFTRSENPLMRSGLAFAGANNAWRGRPVPGIEDGILTAYEVSNMYLPNTKLAVLSACETGLGDIRGAEGVYGLQRAFKMAGVDHLLMSLWKVPDLETAEFMQVFYKNLFEKQSIQEAFSGAQTAMRKKYPKEPYKWAAWVLVR